MHELILLFIGAIIGFLSCSFLNRKLKQEFGCEHNCTAQYNDKKHCMDCGKKLKPCTDK